MSFGNSASEGVVPLLLMVGTRLIGICLTIIGKYLAVYCLNTGNLNSRGWHSDS